jgi:hypothetical protein
LWVQSLSFHFIGPLCLLFIIIFALIWWKIF